MEARKLEKELEKADEDRQAREHAEAQLTPEEREHKR